MKLNICISASALTLDAFSQRRNCSPPMMNVQREVKAKRRIKRSVVPSQTSGKRIRLRLDTFFFLPLPHPFCLTPTLTCSSCWKSSYSSWCLFICMTEDHYRAILLSDGMERFTWLRPRSCKSQLPQTEGVCAARSCRLRAARPAGHLSCTWRDACVSSVLTCQLPLTNKGVVARLSRGDVGLEFFLKKKVITKCRPVIHKDKTTCSAELKSPE